MLTNRECCHKLRLLSKPAEAGVVREKKYFDLKFDQNIVIEFTFLTKGLIFNKFFLLQFGK